MRQGNPPPTEPATNHTGRRGEAIALSTEISLNTFDDARYNVDHDKNRSPVTDNSAAAFADEIKGVVNFIQSWLRTATELATGRRSPHDIVRVRWWDGNITEMPSWQHEIISAEMRAQAQAHKFIEWRTDEHGVRHGGVDADAIARARVVEWKTMSPYAQEQARFSQARREARARCGRQPPGTQHRFRL